MITTDTGAKKWENSDNWRQIYQAHNDSVDAEDAAIAALQDGLAIVANGNTHAAIAAGQFVFVKNHDTLATGLYTASAAIAANATLSGSNLTADASGGLNALNSNFKTYYKTVNKGNIIQSSGTSTYTFEAINVPTGYVCIGSVLISYDGVNSIAVPFWDRNTDTAKVMVYGSVNGGLASARFFFAKADEIT